MPALHSEDVCAASDPRNYEGDGHFSEPCAQALAERIQEWLAEGTEATEG